MRVGAGTEDAALTITVPVSAKGGACDPTGEYRISPLPGHAVLAITRGKRIYRAINGVIVVRAFEYGRVEGIFEAELQELGRADGLRAEAGGEFAGLVNFLCDVLQPSAKDRTGGDDLVRAGLDHPFCRSYLFR
jgi:hypothetical protein